MRGKIRTLIIMTILLVMTQLMYGNPIQDQRLTGAKKTATKVKATKPTKKIIYLTFDDGPSENTDKILEILKKNNIKATFFVIGKNEDRYKKIVDEGHTIALHTLTHKYKDIYASEDAFFKDLYAIRDLIKEKTGVDSKITRFPGGSSTTKMPKAMKAAIIRRMNREGFVYHDWNCDSGDARSLKVTADEILKNSTSCNLSRINLLMHDSSTKQNTVKALQGIIDYYKAKGYNFEKMTDKSFKIQHVKSENYK